MGLSWVGGSAGTPDKKLHQPFVCFGLTSSRLTCGEEEEEEMGEEEDVVVVEEEEVEEKK